MPVEKTTETELSRSPDKRNYFEQLAYRYRKEMRLLFQGGHLWKKEGWRNVAEHCLVQSAAAKELCALLHLSRDKTRAICSATAIHDWRKRRERRPKDFTSEDDARAEKILRQIQPHQELLDATDPDYLEQVYMGSKPPLTNIQEMRFYLDIMTDGDQIVATKERLNHAKIRTPHLAHKANGKNFEMTIQRD